MDTNNIRVKVTAKFGTEGSVLRGDRKAMVDSCVVDVSLDTEAPGERVAQLIREAEAHCYTIAALRNPSPVELMAAVNGKPLDLIGQRRPDHRRDSSDAEGTHRSWIREVPVPKE